MQDYDKIGQLKSQKAGRSLLGNAPKDQKINPQQALMRQYGWNAFYEPTDIKDSRWGNTSYAYDDRGQISQTSFGDKGGEKFTYDPAMNVSAFAEVNDRKTKHGEQGPETAYTMRVERSDRQAPAVAQKFLSWQASKGGRVEVSHGRNGSKTQLTYDSRGRVIERFVERNGFRPQRWKFVWDGRDRLAETLTPDGDKWAYAYDPLGRRISKTQLKRADNDNDNAKWEDVRHIAYHWDGDVLAYEEELINEVPKRIFWHFEPDTFVPLAR